MEKKKYIRKKNCTYHNSKQDQIVRPLDLTLNRLSKIHKDLIFKNWLCKNGQLKEKNSIC